jgi:hypothetical protein
VAATHLVATTVIPLQLLDFFPLHFPIFPWHLPIFPFDLLELVPSLSLVYINSATSRTHEVGKMEAAFKTKITPDTSASLYLFNDKLVPGKDFSSSRPSLCLANNSVRAHSLVSRAFWKHIFVMRSRTWHSRVYTRLRIAE